ncbi:hypothetical protein [Deinococcus sp. QL22]|uniref:hypothetical protein n=1 Tax=Deinococcus sp. QL22 TaxID=2939437 RepID=UPI0020172F42|nr:hypothetical protein [Deinococcus sp. QL22]UQN08757.1 hypothetical protein M1R55_21820 [Deinococcus sp. QL22]
MRNFKSIALIAALALSSAAYAIGSNSVSENEATMTVSANGQSLDSVKFSVGSGSFTIPTANIRSGASFTITIPVRNDTNRAITVTSAHALGGSLASEYVAVTSDNASGVAVAAGATGSVLYTITFDTLASEADRLAFSNKTMSVAFDLTGTSADPVGPVDQSF